MFQSLEVGIAVHTGRGVCDKCAQSATYIEKSELMFLDKLENHGKRDLWTIVARPDPARQMSGALALDTYTRLYKLYIQFMNCMNKLWSSEHEQLFRFRDWHRSHITDPRFTWSFRRKMFDKHHSAWTRNFIFQRAGLLAEVSSLEEPKTESSNNGSSSIEQFAALFWLSNSKTNKKVHLRKR